MIFEYSEIFSQNIEGQYPHLVSGITSVYLQLLGSAEPKEYIILHAYYAYYSRVLQVNTPSFALSRVCCPQYSGSGDRQTFEFIRGIFDIHPQLQKPALSSWHYAVIAAYFLKHNLLVNL